MGRVCHANLAVQPGVYKSGTSVFEKLQSEAISASYGRGTRLSLVSVLIKAGSKRRNPPGKLQDGMEEKRLRAVNHAVSTAGIGEDAAAQVVVLPKVGRHLAYDDGEHKIAPRV